LWPLAVKGYRGRQSQLAEDFMDLRNTPERFGVLAKAFHWIMVGFYALLFPIAWTMTSLPRGPERIPYYALHKSLGVTVLGLAALRLAWRLIDPPPAPPSHSPPWERMAARATQGALYFLMFAMPFAGWGASSAGNHPVSLFGWFTLPPLVAPDHGLQKLFENLHETFGGIILGLLGLHVAAALKHHFVDKDDTLRRMIPWGLVFMALAAWPLSQA
jgi:cytochrome b561